jgi:hypothetical protein
MAGISHAAQIDLRFGDVARAVLGFRVSDSRLMRVRSSEEGFSQFGTNIRAIASST